MKKIKWENVGFIITLLYGVIAILHHTYNELTMLEIPVYLIQAIMVKYSIKYIRLNKKAFLNDFKDIFFE